jgi:hypothetical protein
MGAASVAYTPQGHEPRAITGPTDLGRGNFRWTRSGLRGVDFGGREVNIGQGQ